MTRVESSFSLIPVVTLDMLHFRNGTSPNSFPQTAEFAFVASPPWPSSQFWSISPARRLFEIFSFSHQNSFWPDVIIFWFKKNKAEFVSRTRWLRWTNYALWFTVSGFWFETPSGSDRPGSVLRFAIHCLRVTKRLCFPVRCSYWASI